MQPETSQMCNTTRARITLSLASKRFWPRQRKTHKSAIVTFGTSVKLSVVRFGVESGPSAFNVANWLLGRLECCG